MNLCKYGDKYIDEIEMLVKLDDSQIDTSNIYNIYENAMKNNYCKQVDVIYNNISSNIFNDIFSNETLFTVCGNGYIKMLKLMVNNYGIKYIKVRLGYYTFIKINSDIKDIIEIMNIKNEGSMKCIEICFILSLYYKNYDTVKYLLELDPEYSTNKKYDIYRIKLYRAIQRNQLILYRKKNRKKI
jgi:hypothetical protein